ncbi:CCA tRNA nucleotidyltransferase [Anaerocolumna sp. MB42-C2]|uniref:CCA tRNA nucleotidyltransferase n=1 Tax=Anaerocolumna sp. MB42-C2 TaxID=3070997 RepID=UPI002FE6EF59
MKIELPQKVDYIINELMKNGYEAYAVGGCIRDSILGKEPEDWDITTSAKPQEVKKLFRRTIDTGIVHGTVTVMLEKEGYEVTTYRIDGEYEDNRRPKTVEFTADLIEDLKRRDFTINAMAYNKLKGLVDVFNGLSDLQNGVIRCVGSASERFDEDALRILRAIRFSAQLGFEIEEKTLEAVIAKASNLEAISAERIRVELNKLLLSPHPEKLIDAQKSDITKVVLPEFDTMMNTEQNNPHHIYSVGMHSIKAVKEAGNSAVSFNPKETLVLRWTLLLHDVGKPYCKTTDQKGDHFYGHAEKSAETAKLILRRLKFDNETIDMVFRLIKWHDYKFSLTPQDMRKAVNKIGMDIFDLLFEVKAADTLAQNPNTWKEKMDHLDQAKVIYQEIKANQECVNLKMLKINGKDLIYIGFKPGKEMGEILNRLLEQVLDNPNLNEKQILLRMALQYKPDGIENSEE